MNLQELISKLKGIEFEAQDCGHTSEFISVMAENPNHYLLMDVTEVEFNGSRVVLKFS